MPERLSEFRRRLAVPHQQLESQPLMQRLMSPQVALPTVCDFLSMLHAFYGALEPGLLKQECASGLYRPRLDWLAEDLSALDAGLASPAGLDAWPATPAGVVGVIYAVEGSSLGGQLIDRHLQASLGVAEAGRIRFFRRSAEGIGPHWQRVLARLASVLEDSTKADETTQGATAVFTTLSRLAGAY